MKRIKKAIGSVADNVRKLSRRVGSKRARVQHADQQVDIWRKRLKKPGNRPEEVRKLAYWLKRRDRAHDGLAKYARRLRFQRKKIAFLKKQRDKLAKPPSSGVSSFDGKPVAAWIKPWLEKSRQNGWGGVLVSGYRSPEYSQSLCYRMCGRPSCPGTCAGTSSNHTQHVKPEGAVDVSDYYTFRAVQYRIGSPLRNDLPWDRVHFSSSGH